MRCKAQNGRRIVANFPAWATHALWQQQLKSSTKIKLEPRTIQFAEHLFFKSLDQLRSEEIFPASNLTFPEEVG